MYPGAGFEPQAAPVVVPPPPPLAPPELPPSAAVAPGQAEDQDDLAFQSGRRILKAHQRGVDGAAISQLVVTLPTAIVSLAVVGTFSSMFSDVLGGIVTLAWLLSGVLVFHRPTEGMIAQHLLGMRRPDQAEQERLAAVWAEVTRRAGVQPGTYELWVQERDELNATAAAGHIVAVTSHALEKLPNSQLAAVLAHELGHHVGGHPWAGLLADWYALPARTVGRWIALGVRKLLGSGEAAGIACGGCLVVFFAVFVFMLAFSEGMWWLVLPIIAAPLLVRWLHRRAEYRADDYALGLGFGDELLAVLVEEHRSQPQPPAPGTPPAPPQTPQAPPAYPGYQQPHPAGYPSYPPPQQQPYPGYGIPPQPGVQAGYPLPPQMPQVPPGPQPPRPTVPAARGAKETVAATMVRAPHANFEARIRRLQGRDQLG
ncbi:M48 family metalloprotease [Kitasatospora sp. NPDC002227]|uniref:M48 family metalloprotease n=1 Tax=Kitasatospora sp. NPDC002227 TaxID=3154773 RepID=UPI00331CF6B9